MAWILAGTILAITSVTAPVVALEVVVAGAPYTLRDHPRVLFDGPNGALTATLADPDGPGPKVSAQASPAHPAFAAISDSGLRPCVADDPPCSDGDLAANVLLAALDWFMDNRQSASLRAAKHWLQHLDTLATPGFGFSCDLAAAGCGIAPQAARAAADLPFYALAYTLIHSQLSDAERMAFARRMLNDDDPATGATCRNQLQPVPAGSASADDDASPALRNGTMYALEDWTPDHCGLVWRLRHEAGNVRGRTIGFAATRLTASITAEQMSIRVASTADLPQRVPFLLSLDAAEVVTVRSIDGTTLNVDRGAAGTRPQPFFSGKPVWFTRCLPEVGTDTPTSGAVAEKLFAYAFIGNALADTSAAARELLDAAVDDWRTHVLPANKDMWTGFQQGGSSESGTAMQLTPNAAMAAMLKGFAGEPVLDPSDGLWLRSTVAAQLLTTLPTDATKFLPWGDPANATSPRYGSHLWAPLLAGLYGATSAEAGHWNHWQRSTGQFAAANLARQENLRLAALALIYLRQADPVRDYTEEIPPHHAFTRVDGNPSRALGAWVSRTGWSRPDDTIVFTSLFTGGWRGGHLGFGAPAAYRIFKGGWVLTENGEHETGAGDDTNMPILGERSDLTAARLLTPLRSLDDDVHGAFSYVQVNAQAAYHARASAARVLRSLVHLKKPGTRDYVVVYDSLQSGEPRRKALHLHFDKSPGEAGSMTSTTLPTFDWTGPDRRLSTTVLLPKAGEVVARYESLPAAHRLALCASVDGETCDEENIVTAFLVVHRPTVNVAEAMPPVRLLDDVSAGYVAVQIEGADPKVVVFPAAGMPTSGVALTTTFAGTAQMLFTALEAGLYDVVVGGSTVCAGVAATAAGEAVYCEAGGGEVRVTRVGPLPRANQ
jgi:hypothetical protein